VLIIVAIVVSTDSFASAQAVAYSLVRTAPPLIIVALAAALVISVGEIDIALGSVFALTGVVFFAFLSTAGPLDHKSHESIVYLALGASALVTLLIYAGMSALIAIFGFPALLSTLAVLLAGRGLSVLIQNFLNRADAAGALASTLSLPPFLHPSLGPGWLWAVAMCSAIAAWRYMSFSGLRHIAVGMDRRSARMAGLNIRTAQLVAFAIAGLLVALATHLTLFQVSGGSWAGNFGWGLELSAIAAAVIGGCRITGGRFDPFCVALGAIFVRATEDAAGAFNLPSEFFYIVLGTGLLVAAVLDGVATAGSRSSVYARLLRQR
jgi:ribose/xylose/arabinose/galactoside ABC-type transport system permease subunit